MAMGSGGTGWRRRRRKYKEGEILNVAHCFT